MKNIFMLILTIALVIVGYLGYQRFMNTSSQDKNKKSSAPQVEQKMYTFSIDGKTAKGVKQWHLEGQAAEMVDDGIHLEDLNAVAFNEQVTVNLESDKGIYNKDKGEVELIGNVKVTTEDGGVLTTDHAKWSQVTKEIETDAIVNIKRENMIATGKGAKANSDEKRATLLSDVNVKLEPQTDIHCDGELLILFGENKATFNKNVKVKDKDGELFADTLTVFIDPASKKIAQVVAEGNVKLVRGKSYTLCGKATYTDGTR
ncbi:MAG TPA: LPS export ABC transporter periplasmic protein LptC, partial [Candidatus Omnitrophota bacterium]|nr:LPS export ABC transporter periplasmic protein LptC [Candidatus Omnitrophota bacterium]